MYFGFRGPDDLTTGKEYIMNLISFGFDWMEIDAPYERDRGLEKRLTSLRCDTGLNLSVHAHFVDVNLASSHPAVRRNAVEIIKRDIDFAANCGAQLVVVHPGDIGWFDFLPPGHSGYAAAQAIIDRFRLGNTVNAVNSIAECGAHARGCNVRLAFENMYCPWDVLVSPEEIAQAFAEHELENVGFVLDFGHSMVGRRKPEDYVRALGTRIWHSHIHQNDGRYDTHSPLSFQGMEQYSEAVRGLVQVNPSVTLLLELPLGKMQHKASIEYLRLALT